MASLMTRDEMIEEVRLEGNICKHLHEKIAAYDMDYRPTPGQRSTLELLRYLAVCGIGSARALEIGDWQAENQLWGRSAAMTFEEFPAAMDRQVEEVVALLERIPEEDFATRVVPYVTGMPLTLGRALVKTTLKWLTAYRMQLFLYAKSMGGTHLHTLDNWDGVDQPEAVAAA